MVKSKFIKPEKTIPDEPNRWTVNLSFQMSFCLILHLLLKDIFEGLKFVPLNEFQMLYLGYILTDTHYKIYDTKGFL